MHSQESLPDQLILGSETKINNQTYPSFKVFYEKKLIEINRDSKLSEDEKNLKTINLIKFIFFHKTMNIIQKFLTQYPKENFILDEYTNSYRLNAVRIADFFNQTNFDKSHWYLLLVKNLLTNVFYNHTNFSESSQLLKYCHHQINFLFDIEDSMNFKKNSEPQFEDTSYIPEYLLTQVSKDKALDKLDSRFLYFCKKQFYLSFSVNANTFTDLIPSFNEPSEKELATEYSQKKFGSINFYDENGFFLRKQKAKRKGIATDLSPAKFIKSTDACSLLCVAKAGHNLNNSSRISIANLCN